MNYALEVKGIETSYGNSRVLFGIDLAIQEGEVSTILGRNGMGKTTSVRSILGLTPVSAGTIRFRGELIHDKSSDVISQKGIAVVPEGRHVFPNLSVRENLIAFAANRNGSREPWTLEKVYAFFPRLKERERNMGNELSGGEQQMVAISRALMTNPHLLILDEATEGLAPMIREEIWQCLATLRASGQTILVIDKYIERLIVLADSHTILERGKVVWKGSSDALAADRSIWELYLGV